VSEPTDWEQLVVSLCEHYGYTPRQVGDLTQSQAELLLTLPNGGGSRRERSDAAGFIAAVGM
jgi:hypothetical protein